MRYFLLFFLCALTPLLTAEPTSSPEQSTQTTTATLQEAQKTIRALASIKEAIESTLLESENGLWPRSDELFKAAAQLIISCYSQKQSLNSLHARVYIATLEDYVGSLLQQEPHLLACATPTVKKLTNKALREITTATKTPLIDPTPEAVAATETFERTIKKTILFIKSQFLPPEPILPRDETLIEKIKKKGRSAYNYMAETIEENPFTSGVVVAIVVCGTLYWVKAKYFSPSESGIRSGNKTKQTGSKPPPETPLDPNVTLESIAAPHQGDGKSCGYHSAENALAFAKALAAEKKIKGRQLSAQEIEEILRKMVWPTKQTIQTEDKAAFLKADYEKINALKAGLGSRNITDAQRKEITKIRNKAGKTLDQQRAEITEKVFAGSAPTDLKQILELARQIDQLEILTNHGGWIEGEALRKFVAYLQEKDVLTKEITFQDTDEDHGFHWDLYEVGTASDAHGSIENTMRKIFDDTQNLLKQIESGAINVADLQSILTGLKNKRTGEYHQSTLKTTIAGSLKLEDVLAIKEVLPSQTLGKDRKPIGYRNSPVFFRFLSSFHQGFPLILNWHQPGHWTCNIVIPALPASGTSATPAQLKAKGFVVDSYGTSQPPQFKNLLNFLIQKKPLSPDEVTTLQSVFTPAADPA